ncbi:unnamed protein product [Peniophora sp. CBMAI 1063]|nr:unnamed protein product [Peniophora sp. CBMAI 1063]
MHTDSEDSDDGGGASPVGRSKNDTDNPYTSTLANKDERLKALATEYSKTKPCLRTVSYAFRQWSWLSDFILDEATLANSSRKAIRGDVPRIVLDLAEFLDDWERHKVYEVKDGTESVRCYFRRLGIEKEGSVSPGAHDFGRLHPLTKSFSTLSTHKILFVYRTLDVLAWLSGAGETTQARAVQNSNDIASLAPALSADKFPAIKNWVNALNETAKACVPETTSRGELPVVDWDNLQTAFPSRYQVRSMKLGPIGQDRNNMRINEIAVRNIETAAFALCYLLKECYDHDDNLSHINLTDLKKHCGGDVDRCRNVWATLAMALFVSPVLLLCRKDIFKMEIPLIRLWEFWRRLGNNDRPAALVKVEKQIWKIILDVMYGSQASDCLASFAKYWLDSEGLSEKGGYASWFVAPGTARPDPSTIQPKDPASNPARTQPLQQASLFKIDSMKKEIQEQNKRIAELEETNASIEQAKQKADDALLEYQRKALNRCTQLLNGHPEAGGVTDLSGALAALQRTMARMSSETEKVSAAKQKELNQTRKELQQTQKELQEKNQELKELHAAVLGSAG